jgi:hypothetical protein
MPDLPYSHEVSDTRIKRLMTDVGMPDSISLMLAMKQLENEVRLEVSPEFQRLQTWVNDLQSGMFINCVYCGHRYGPKNETPVAMADVLKAHIVECPKHPLSLVTNALSHLVAAKRHKDQYGKTPEYEKARDAAWNLAEVALKAVRG